MYKEEMDRLGFNEGGWFKKLSALGSFFGAVADAAPTSSNGATGAVVPMPILESFMVILGVPAEVSVKYKFPSPEPIL